MEKLKQIAKAVVAVGGFLVIVGTQVIDGHIDFEAVWTALVAALVAVGVWRVPNSNPAS